MDILPIEKLTKNIGTVINVNQLNLRSEPLDNGQGSESNVIGRLSQGTKFLILEEKLTPDETWYKVRLSEKNEEADKVGYCRIIDGFSGLTTFEFDSFELNSKIIIDTINEKNKIILRLFVLDNHIDDEYQLLEIDDNKKVEYLIQVTKDESNNKYLFEFSINFNFDGDKLVIFNSISKELEGDIKKVISIAYDQLKIWFELLQFKPDTFLNTVGF